MCFLPELIPKFHPVCFDPTLFKKAAPSGSLCLRIPEVRRKVRLKNILILEYSLSVVLLGARGFVEITNSRLIIHCYSVIGGRLVCQVV
ncbi:hypothetical protein IQB76_00075 [Leptospira borgpetersenii serovar Hardjo-bovis]|uniref:Uncharacterized protein n=1 Tax=Leptospira borgpetersenii serovar Hardjo-bovis str. Sponselee TaxID=1303729 RepID=M6BXC6_LEPBO|nr:hypothetical protein [Leptospira borgpetersenii]AMX58092.1 hypothetical protein LBK6_06985 [Leptospira borgpetersenii serovar Hardjo]AMX61344.1 hypothetical protein LBK9_07000 [Leptospira borgpetersenii serovar Hardjo]AMX64589.1 hypothetical protein LBK30_07065 [Leptospira borgpetersenii serovar Hardjo]AMX67807.1 hypothetical protein LBHA_06925 [Leptospira borgpetersenii serovar Hardjo]AWV69966.1 hypothetical protein B9T54_07680 [Leptospira borgpetersenii serovar Hardjo-bovis]